MTKKLSTPFAINSTLRNDVPVNATNDQTNKGIVGYNNGWTSINKLPLENGGQPPYMEDMNGVLFDITGNIVDINKGLPQYYDDAYATLIVGYPVGARICLNDNSGFVISTIANNQNNPNTNMTGWSLQSATSITTSNEINVDTWLSNLAITPDLFLTQAGNDDLKAFYLACDKANSLNLPVTLLPRTYELSDSIDLRKASCGITTSSERFSATTLKAIANTSNASTFVNYQNMDRTKLCSFRVDANSLYDIGIDTSYPVIGPSLNITFDTIWVRGYNKIGWLAENNSDVYWKSCAIFEPGTKSDKTVISIRCVTIGGPAQFECCNFLGGKQQVAAQHITNIMCVLSGIEFLKGSWNNYSAVGTHHFSDLATNSCFTITGEIWGFSVSGGLCEASNNGYLFSGNGGNTVTGKLQFNGTKVTPNEGSMYLDKGTLGIKYGKLVASFNGGMQNLTGLGNLNIFDDVSLDSTNNTVAAVSKYVTASSGDLRSYHAGYGEFYTDKYSQLNDTGIFYTPSRIFFLESTGGYFGVVSPFSRVPINGTLRMLTSDNKRYCEYQLSVMQKIDGSGLSYSTTKITDTSPSTSNFALYYDGNGDLQVNLGRESGDSSLVRIHFSFTGFVGKI